MTCQELVEFLYEYLNDQLPVLEATLFQKHLDECADCRAYISTYRKTIELSKDAFHDSREVSLERIPDELVHAILAARRMA